MLSTKPARRRSAPEAAGAVVAMVVAVAAEGTAAIAAAVGAAAEVTVETAEIAATAGNSLLLLSFPFTVSGQPPMRLKHNSQPAESIQGIGVP